MSTLLCQTVTGRTMAELIAARDAADGGDVGGDMVELRLDYVDRPDVAGALAGRRKPVIVTVNGREVFSGAVKKDVATLMKWAARDNDRTMLYGAELPIIVP